LLSGRRLTCRRRAKHRDRRVQRLPRAPADAERIMRNLADLLAHRLLQANTKIELLSAN
jgi:hypothetical protein